jgi:hypothetical protein
MTDSKSTLVRWNLTPPNPPTRAENIPCIVPTSPDMQAISLNELESAVTSLYWDQIKPSMADILHRLGELYPTRNHLWDESTILSFAERNLPNLCFNVDKSGKLWVELIDEPTWFNGWIDPCVIGERFPEGVWDGLHHFVVCLCVKEAVSNDTLKPYQFKGGRYGLSRVLQDRILSLYHIDRHSECASCEAFFELIQFYSLGRLCQLVQTAIQRGLLRYEDNLLQPTVCCSTPSAAYASKLIPVEAPRSNFRDISSLEELTSCLYELFCLENVIELPLSQLKKRILSNFELVLNPVSLGFVKLSDALKSVVGVEVVTEGNNAIIKLSEFTPSTTYSRGA